MTSSTGPIRGSIVALITPLLEGGGVDYPALRKLIDWHIDQGTDCIGVVGTTGESPTVTVEEHCEIIRVSVEQAAGRKPVMAGCGANSTREAIELAQFAKKVGADCQLQVVPYYNKPTQEGQYQHFKAIAEATGDLPVILYNVPGRSAADMAHETVIAPGAGARHRGHQGSHRQHRTRAMADQGSAQASFSIYSGDDPTAVALMLCGGHGNVSVTANMAPRLMHELCVAAMAGDVAKAMEIQMRLLPLHKNAVRRIQPHPGEVGGVPHGPVWPGIAPAADPADAAPTSNCWKA